MSRSGETPLRAHEHLKPINEWIVAASKDAGIAYVNTYKKPSPEIGDKFPSFIELYKCLEAINIENPELAKNMRVRYVDYKRFYEEGTNGNIVGNLNDLLLELGEDAIRYLNHTERYLKFDKALPIYRHPDNPTQLLTLQDYLEYRLNNIEDESGVGVMLVDMNRDVGYVNGYQDTVNTLTGEGRYRLTLNDINKNVSVDDLGIIEWLALVSQVVVHEYGLPDTEQEVPIPKYSYSLPQLSGSSLLANRTPSDGSCPNHSLYTQFSRDAHGFRNTIGVVSGNMENAATRPAIVR